MPRKIVYCKLSEHVIDVPTADGYYTVTFTDHHAEVPNEIAHILRASDFYRIVRDVWNEPLKKVLLIRGGGVGDILLTTPLVRHLYNQGITVDYLTSPSSACLLQGNPYINQILTARLSGWPDIQDDATEYDLEAARDVYDAIVDLRWYPERSEMNGIVSHRVDAFFHAMGITDVPNDRSLDYMVTEREKQITRAYHVTFGPSVAYVWSSTTANRNWTAEQHHTAIQSLVDAKLNVVILSETQQQVYGWVTNLTGKLTIRETAAVIEECDVVVTPDTGLMHIAQALGVPTLAYMGCFPADSRATRELTVINETSRCEQFPCRSYQCAYQGTPQENQCLKVAPEALVDAVLSKVKGVRNGISSAVGFVESGCYSPPSS